MQWLKIWVLVGALSLPLKAEEEAHSGGGEQPKPTPTTTVPQTSFTPVAQPSVSPSVSLVKPEIQAFLDQLRPLNLPTNVLDRVKSVVEQASSPERLQKDLANLFQQENLPVNEGQKSALLGLVKDQVINPQKLQDLSLAFKELSQKPAVSDPNVSALSALQQMQGTLGQLAEKILGDAKKGSDATSSDKNFGKVLEAITAMSKNFNNDVPSSKGDSDDRKSKEDKRDRDREGGREREGRDRDFSKADFFKDRFGERPPGPPDRDRRRDKDRDKDRPDPSERFAKNDRRDRDRRSFPEPNKSDDSKNSKSGDSEKTSSYTPPPPPKPKVDDLDASKVNSALDAAKALAGGTDKAGLPEANKTAVNTNVTPLQAMPPPSAGFGLTSNASIGGSFGLPSAPAPAGGFGFGGGAPIQQSSGSSGGGLSVFDGDFGKMTFDGQAAPGYTGGYQYAKPVEYTVSSAVGGEVMSPEVDGGPDYIPSNNGRVPMGPAPLNPAGGKGVRKGPEASALQYQGGLISKICNAPFSNEIGICLTLDRAKKNKENKSFFSEILRGLR